MVRSRMAAMRWRWEHRLDAGSCGTMAPGWGFVLGVTDRCDRLLRQETDREALEDPQLC
jgi:hypothetical protein